LASTVEGYLAELRTALAGADPALVQDALYDAEEYLRSASAESGDTPESTARAIEAYGTPAEVAMAYRDAEITVTAALRKPAPTVAASRNPIARFFGVLADPGAWGALFYLLLSLATGIAYFTIVVTGVSVALGTAILIVGVPIALLVLAIVRAVSLAEGRMVEGLLGVRMPRRPRLVAGAQGNIWTRIKGWLSDWRTWTTMLYMVVQLFLGILYFTIIVTALATSAALVAAPFVQVLTGEPVMRTFEYGYYLQAWAYPFVVVLGLLGFVVTLWIAKGLGAMHGAYAKALLVGRTEPAENTAATVAAPEGGNE